MHTAQRCEHDRVTVWSGWSRRGELLPEIEHCEVCNPGATPLTQEH